MKSLNTQLSARRIFDNQDQSKTSSERQLLLSAKPWITRGIKIYIKIKNSLYKSYLKTKTTITFLNINSTETS